MSAAEIFSGNEETVLLAKIAEGDERAFHQLVRNYHGKVFFHALTFTKSHVDAEEITQDIFLKIWEQRDKLPEIERFKDYLFILGRNQIISAMRKKVRSDGVLSGDYPEEILSPGRQLEAKEIYTIIQKGIEQLPPQQQAVFRLSRLEQLSHEQIAEHLGISKHAVNWHIVKALNFLRFYLGKRGTITRSFMWGSGVIFLI